MNVTAKPGLNFILKSYIATKNHGISADYVSVQYNHIILASSKRVLLITAVTDIDDH